AAVGNRRDNAPTSQGVAYGHHRGSGGEGRGEPAHLQARGNPPPSQQWPDKGTGSVSPLSRASIVRKGKRRDDATTPLTEGWGPGGGRRQWTSALRMAFS